MASPEELTPLLPDTLPEDFSEWDGEATAEPSPIKPSEWEAWEATHSFGEPKSPTGQSTARSSAPAPASEKPRASDSAPSGPVVVAQQKHFVDWDGETSPTPKPVDLSEWEAWEAAHSFGKTPAPPKPSPELKGNASPVVETPRTPVTVPPATFPARQQESATKPSNGANGSASHAPRRQEVSRSTKETMAAPSLLKAATVDTKPDGAYVAKTQRADDQALFQTFAPESAEVSEKPKTAKKKWMIIAPVSGASVLLLLALTGMLLHRGSKPEAKPPVQPPAQTSETQTVPDDSNSPNSAPAAQTPPSPATETQPAASTPASSGQDGVKPAPGLTKKQTKLMNDQLAAPTVIPQNKQSAENAPPPVNIAANGADGLGGMGANDGVLNGHTQAAPKVVSARPFAISSGVAAGMLIRQTPPVYPAIAKAAGVSGTVVLHATITRNGTIKDVQVVSGSPMLQQAALDAVRTWRYKPYKLSNEPIEVDTAISVVFSAAK